METSLQTLAESSRVVRLTLDRMSGELCLRLLLEGAESGADLSLTFFGVSELRFRSERTELMELVLLVVEDLSSRGLEDVRFRVKDSEEEFASFYCREIRKESIAPTAT